MFYHCTFIISFEGGGTHFINSFFLSSQMVDRLVVQLQDLISELRLSKDTDTQNEIKAAKNYVQDADKLKQVCNIKTVEWPGLPQVSCSSVVEHPN